MNETLVPTTDLNHAGHRTDHLDPNVARVSLLTPPGRGAVATIRVEGPTGLDGHACPWETRLAQSFVPTGRRSIQKMSVNGIVFGRWIGPQKEDEKTPAEDVVLTRRGENSIEIHCHGGHVAVRRIMADLVNLGAAEVSWQEQLAWRTDLLEAECVAALSQTTTARTAAMVMEQANGRLRETFVYLNYLAEEGLTAELVFFLDGMLASSRFGLHLTRPWSVVLTGRPNVGKSSLINRLLGYERAIVFDQPGTTRDVVTGETAFDGWPVLLADTAGIRTAPEELEAAGIALARQRLQTADLRLVLIDLSQAPTEDDQRLLADWPDALVVAHKCDLDTTPSLWEGRLPPSALRVSSATGEGIEALQKQLVQWLVPAVPPPGTLLLLTERQVKLFTAIRRAVDGGEHSLVPQLCRELIDGEVVG